MWPAFLYFILLFGHLFLTETASAVRAPLKVLNDGNRIPALALGTGIRKSEKLKMKETIYRAVRAGYRHIDTSALHGAEGFVGVGIKRVISMGMVRREDLFVTTKLPGCVPRARVKLALQTSLMKLGLKYVDLYLIHAPVSVDEDMVMQGEILADNETILDTWKGMEAVKKAGLAKSIGVSNFNIPQIDYLYSNSEIKPAVNQVEVHPACTRESLVSHCQKLNITVMAYSPLGYLVDRRGISRIPQKPADYVPDVILKLSLKYKKTPTQIALRYLLDRDLIPLPRSTKKIHLRENIHVFDFNLTKEEITSINKLNTNEPMYGWSIDE